MKRVLYVAIHFPPVAEVASQRPARLVRHLFRYGWEPQVLTIDNRCIWPRDPSLMGMLSHDVKVHRAPCGNWFIHQYNLRHRLRNPLLRTLQIPQYVIGRALHLHLVPDPYITWRDAAILRAEQQHGETPFDLLIASISPWSAGVIVRDISRRLGVPYVIDARDPWTLEETHAAGMSARRFSEEQALERQVLADCSAWVTVTAGMESMYLDGYPRELTGKTAVVTNSFDLDEWTNVQPHRFERFTMIFAGNIHRWVSLKAMMNVLVRLRDSGRLQPQEFQFLCYGIVARDERAYASRLGLDEQIVRFHPPVPRAELKSLLKGAQLLLAAARWPFAIPGKVLDYLCTDNPILLIAPPDGDGARAITQTGRGWVFAEQQEADIAEAIANCIERHRSGEPLMRFADTDARLLYSTQHTAAMFARVLDQVVATRLPVGGRPRSAANTSCSTAIEA